MPGEIVRKTGVFGWVSFILGFMPFVYGLGVIVGIIAIVRGEARVLPVVGIIFGLAPWAAVLVTAMT